MDNPGDRPAHEPPLVIDFTAAWAGPLCGCVLADFGWRVIKVETSTRPDVTRRLGPFAGGIAGLERSGYFETLNRGKQSIALDLTTETGRQFARQLCDRADAVVENFSPGVMERLGLSYAELARTNPSLVMVSISGYGATGPERNYVAYGQTIEAVSGLDAATGYAGGSPAACGAPIADHVAGMTGALGAFAAMRRRRNSGVGCHVDVSMVEALLSLTPTGLLDYQLTGHLQEPRGNQDDRLAPHGCYPCAGEDSWVALAIGADGGWHALCEVLGLGAAKQDPKFAGQYRRWVSRAELDAIVAEATHHWQADELTSALRRAGIAATQVLNVDGLNLDESLSARRFFAEIETAEAGRRLIPGRQARFSFLDAGLRVRAPRLGEHTTAVLEELLGMADEDIRAARDAGALR